MRNELKNKCGQKIIEASKLRTIEKISFLKPTESKTEYICPGWCDSFS